VTFDSLGIQHDRAFARPDSRRIELPAWFARGRLLAEEEESASKPPLHFVTRGTPARAGKDHYRFSHSARLSAPMVQLVRSSDYHKKIFCGHRVTPVYSVAVLQ
jgi:hypothetical protein